MLFILKNKNYFQTYIIILTFWIFSFELTKASLHNEAAKDLPTKRIDRTVSTLIHDDHHILFVKDRDGTIAFPGGFVDAAEATATAAEREAKEELGGGMQFESRLFTPLAFIPESNHSVFVYFPHPNLLSLVGNINPIDNKPCHNEKVSALVLSKEDVDLAYLKEARTKNLNLKVVTLNIGGQALYIHKYALDSFIKSLESLRVWNIDKSKKDQLALKQDVRYVFNYHAGRNVPLFTILLSPKEIEDVLLEAQHICWQRGMNANYAIPEAYKEIIFDEPARKVLSWIKGLPSLHYKFFPREYDESVIRTAKEICWKYNKKSPDSDTIKEAYNLTMKESGALSFKDNGLGSISFNVLTRKIIFSAFKSGKTTLPVLCWESIALNGYAPNKILAKIHIVDGVLRKAVPSFQVGEAVEKNANILAQLSCNSIISERLFFLDQLHNSFYCDIKLDWQP